MKRANDVASPATFHEGSTDSQRVHTLARMAMQLLCHLTFQPPAAQASESTSAIVHECWEALVHALPADQHAEVITVAHSLIAGLEARMLAGSLPPHEEQMFCVLSAFAAGELG
jgi:hypothetical protein